MSSPGHRSRRTPKHPYLSGNFAPVDKTWPPTPVTWTGDVPAELHGGMYVRNGGNPVTNHDLGREAHWFDGDGMLSGVWFDRSPASPQQPVVNFVNQFILTDVYLSAVEPSALQTPILPSIATLVNPASSLFFILWRILRSVLIVLLSHLPGSWCTIKRISVANTGILFHDGRALATCESGPPIRVTLPGLDTVGWFDGNRAEGEATQTTPSQSPKEQHPSFGGTGPLSWMKEWTTGHPKVDILTDELVLFHCNFVAPYVHYSLIPTMTADETQSLTEAGAILNAPVPGCSGGRLMHDFGVSRQHTVILDLPLSLTPLNLAKNKPVLCYEPQKPARFGVFPRRQPEQVRWFETQGCCIFHTANTWDEYDSNGVTAVNLLACRLTSASLVFSAGNIVPPPHPSHNNPLPSKPMSFFAKYDDEEVFNDPEKLVVDETSPLLGFEASRLPDYGAGASQLISEVPISYDEQEQCRLYYYRFSLHLATTNLITHEFALSAIPFEFPTVSPLTEMSHARYVYGCSTSIETFGAALGKATKIDVLVRIDVKALLDQAQHSNPEAVVGCVDNRSIDQILASTCVDDPIKAFKLPPNHYGQEATFIPRSRGNSSSDDVHGYDEDSGYLIFYVFDEGQLDNDGECRESAKSEMWILDAHTMQDVVCKIKLPTRIPYGLHGNWFTEEQIQCQRSVDTLRTQAGKNRYKNWSRVRRALVGHLG